MPTDPFEDEDAVCLVLRNDENQHALWPEFADVPAGWHLVHGHATRRVCLAYVEEHWTALRPRSLVEAMAAELPADKERLSGERGR